MVRDVHVFGDAHGGAEITKPASQQTPSPLVSQSLKPFAGSAIPCPSTHAAVVLHTPPTAEHVFVAPRHVGEFHGHGNAPLLANTLIIVAIISHEPNVMNRPTTAAVAMVRALVCSAGFPPEIIKKNPASTIINTASGNAICHHKKSMMFLMVTKISQKLHGITSPLTVFPPHSTNTASAGIANESAETAAIKIEKTKKVFLISLFLKIIRTMRI